MQDLLRDMLVWMGYFLAISISGIVIIRLIAWRVSRRNQPRD
jgi:hypothetical protein